MSTAYGVKQNCPLNSLRYFHVINGLPSDIAHDFFEGVCPLILGKVLTTYVREGQIYIETINMKLQGFHYQCSEKSNKPSLLSWSHSSVKIKQKACQMWCLMRLFFLMFADNIVDKGENWQLLLHLIDIVDLVTSPAITSDSCEYINGLVLIFFEMFHELYHP